MKRDRERTAKGRRREPARREPEGPPGGPALPYSYGSRDVQPGYEATWKPAERGIGPDPWSDPG